jgi:23S rRNA pseudouridine2605 synthase
MGPPKPDDGRERLQKVLAAAGIASRRECEELIAEGRVEVDNQVVTELGTRVDPRSQTIHVDGELLHKPKLVYFAVNKPEGVVSTARDQAGRPRVTDLLPRDTPRVFNVGRLDMASEGLILMTNDGELANKLTHPRHGVEKTYHVQVAGNPETTLLGQLTKGVYLADGHVKAVRAQFKGKHKKSTIIEIVLNEGKNREIRRLLAKLGHKVQRLTRVAVGPVKLGEMPPGAFRPLDTREIGLLKKVADGIDIAPAKKLRRRPAAKKTVGDDKRPVDRTRPQIQKKAAGPGKSRRPSRGK